MIIIICIIFLVLIVTIVNNYEKFCCYCEYDDDNYGSSSSYQYWLLYFGEGFLILNPTSRWRPELQTPLV